MAVELDNLHYDYRAIDGYNKPFNFIIAPRELGKTAMAWLKKIYLKWKVNKKPWIYLVRQVVEITEALINSIADTTINKFTDDNVILKYTKGNFKDGIVDVYIGGELFFRIVALSIQLRRIKLAVLKGCAGVLIDEYIIDPKTQEKYIQNEAFKIKEAYTTWRREADGILKVYILGNPYSLFNPLFMEWKVDTNKLEIGKFYVGDIFVIHRATLSQALREKLLKANPLYKFDEDYIQYALEGQAINDKNIQLGSQPEGYKLRFVIRIQNKIIGIFRNDTSNREDNLYFCKFVDEVSAKRVVYCFEFEDLVNGSQVMSLDDRFKFNNFKDALRKRLVIFEDINVYYIVEEVYKNI